VVTENSAASSRGDFHALFHSANNAVEIRTDAGKSGLARENRMNSSADASAISKGSARRATDVGNVPPCARQTRDNPKPR